MKKVKIVVVLMIMTCLIFPQSSFAKDTKKVGNVLSASGDVEMKKGGGKKTFKVFKNMAFTQGDTVITGSNGKAELSLDKDKEVVVGSNTKLVISELISSVKAKSGKTELTLVGGKVKVKVNKKLEGESRFKIQTPNAIMGVMGTEFYVYYDELGTWTGVLEGEVTVDIGGAPPIKVGANHSLVIDDEGNHKVIELDAEQVLRFKLEGSNEAQGKPLKQVIVYDPVVKVPVEDNPTINVPNIPDAGPPPQVQNPIFVSAEEYNPDPELRNQLKIEYASYGDTLTKIVVVIDQNTIEEVEEIHFDRLDNGVLLKKEFLQNMIQSDLSSTEMRLEFASGFILPVTLNRMALVEVDEDTFKAEFLDEYQKNNNIVIPFTQSIEFNSGDDQAPSSLEAGVLLEGGTGDQSVISNVTIDKNRLVIKLDGPLPVSAGGNYTVVITNYTLRTQENGVVQRECIVIQLPELELD